MATPETLDKGQVAAILEEVANLQELTGVSQFEVRAYQNAARAIENLDGDIGEIVKSGKIGSVPGVGKTLAARITELVTTGKMALHEQLLAEVPAGLRDMLRIPGLGPKRIRQIHDALGVATLDDLRAACENGQVATLPGFGAKSQEKILKGLQFLSEHQDHYRYDIAARDATAIAETLRALPQVVRLSVAGSLRRHKEVVKDMDIVAASPATRTACRLWIRWWTCHRCAPSPARAAPKPASCCAPASPWICAWSSITNIPMRCTTSPDPKNTTWRCAPGRIRAASRSTSTASSRTSNSSPAPMRRICTARWAWRSWSRSYGRIAARSRRRARASYPRSSPRMICRASCMCIAPGAMGRRRSARWPRRRWHWASTIWACATIARSPSMRTA